MYLQDEIKKKFINEVSNTLIDSLKDYSDYIDEKQNFEYYSELTDAHLIGYYKCEMFLTDKKRFSAFNIVRDYVADYSNIIGVAPFQDSGISSANYINSESIYHFYFHLFMTNLVYHIQDENLIHTWTDYKNGVNYDKLEEIIEGWRERELNELLAF